MHSDFKRYSALIHRTGNHDCFYGFGDPVDEISGGSEQWPLFEQKLLGHQVSGWDRMHPPGAAVGYFSYEGEFHFRFYPDLEVIPTDAIHVSTEQLQNRAHQSAGDWSTTHTRQTYQTMVESAQEAIRRGDIYQVNLARKFERIVSGWDAEHFFKTLWHTTRAPYTGFLRFVDSEIYAASPELFLNIQGRHITTQPIKGTRPRGVDAMDDRRNALELATNAKEVAELVMITDLARNDLGVICDYGSVEVKELVRCRTYSHVFHLVSTVTGRLRDDLTPIQAVQACYPGGSITGAPKRKAMEMIQQLEKQPRGFYTGAFGYFGFDGSAQLGMSIRTCQRHGNKLSFWTGSGITIDSNPLEEFEETNHKARAMQDAFQLYQNTIPNKVGCL
jgi:para-aminobenzoate synthetase component I